MMADIFILKESGQRELFSSAKIVRALSRSGVPKSEQQKILSKLESFLYDGITTREIFTILKTIIESDRPQSAHKFNLKRALFELGPEGHYFEDFIHRLLSTLGYSCNVRQTLQGKFVTHETDVVAKKGPNVFLVECKFHNQPGIKCRIQTVLYVYARFLDVEAGYKEGLCQKITKPFLITNTKFSEDVIKYASGMKIPLLGWHYPQNESLEHLIDKTKCYPITVLPLKNETRTILLNSGFTVVSDLPHDPKLLSEKTSIPLKTCHEIISRAKYVH
jgi:hypothetical protein